MNTHCSWDEKSLNTNIDQQVIKLQQQCKKSHYTKKSQHNLIPVYDISELDINNTEIQTEIYDLFFNNVGALIIKGCYTPKLMDKYNKWCEQTLEEAKDDPNCIHPKQAGKNLINNLIERMSETNPTLLIQLINNKTLNTFVDILLGHATFGSCTTHWINPGGKRQLSHVDYPIHVGSGPFWGKGTHKLEALTTRHQINHILPYFSVQALVASDAMNQLNGSTELVPCSHLIPDLDLLIHNPEVYQAFEKHFVNATLEQGDVLIFNRRLCHRGGENLSDKRRNSLITQYVYLWGVGQEIIDSTKIISNLENTEIYQKMTSEEQEELILRLKKPYPLDVSQQA